MGGVVQLRGRVMALLIVASAALALTTSCSGSDASDASAGTGEAAEVTGSSVSGDDAGAASATDDSSASPAGQDDPGSTSTPPGTSPPPVETAPTSDTDQSNSSSDPSGDDDTTVAPLEVAVPGPTVTAGMDDDAAFGTGISASVVDVESVDIVGRLRGERSGPGVAVTVAVTNASTAPISLDLVIVDLLGSDGASAVPIGSSSEDRLTGELDPGQSATGQYQYFIPPDLRQSATIAISYSADAPTALFMGALPDA